MKICLFCKKEIESNHGNRKYCDGCNSEVKNNRNKEKYKQFKQYKIAIIPELVSRKRHIAKTISYRVVSTGVGFMIMWLVSGSVKVGAAFGIAELVYKPIQYYIHERVWYKYIKYGLSKKK